MLDIKFVRENSDIVKQNIKNKFQDKKLPLVDEVIELDDQNRKIKKEVESLRAEKNSLSKKIGGLMKEGKKEEAEEIKAKVAAGNAKIDELTAEEKENVKAGIKEGLEGLAGKIPGLVDVKVNINGLPTSTVDVMLDTTFTDADALKAYSTNPLHVAVADGKVRPYTAVRSCLDYEV